MTSLANSTMKGYQVARKKVTKEQKAREWISSLPASKKLTRAAINRIVDAEVNGNRKNAREQLADENESQRAKARKPPSVYTPTVTEVTDHITKEITKLRRSVNKANVRKRVGYTSSAGRRKLVQMTGEQLRQTAKVDGADEEMRDELLKPNSPSVNPAWYK